jgi:hypothetical protein
MLELVDEALALLSPEKRWGVTFSTYYAGAAQGISLGLRCMVQGSVEAKAAKKLSGALCIDLTAPSGEARTSVFVEAARTGRAVASLEGVGTQYRPDYADAELTETESLDATAPPARHEAGVAARRIILAEPLLSQPPPLPSPEPMEHRTSSLRLSFAAGVALGLVVAASIGAWGLLRSREATAADLQLNDANNRLSELKKELGTLATLRENLDSKDRTLKRLEHERTDAQAQVKELTNSLEKQKKASETAAHVRPAEQGKRSEAVQDNSLIKQGEHPIAETTKLDGNKAPAYGRAQATALQDPIKTASTTPKETMVEYFCSLPSNPQLSAEDDLTPRRIGDRNAGIRLGPNPKFHLRGMDEINKALPVRLAESADKDGLVITDQSTDPPIPICRFEPQSSGLHFVWSVKDPDHAVARRAVRNAVLEISDAGGQIEPRYVSLLHEKPRWDGIEWQLDGKAERKWVLDCFGNPEDRPINPLRLLVPNCKADISVVGQKGPSPNCLELSFNANQKISWSLEESQGKLQLAAAWTFPDDWKRSRLQATIHVEMVAIGTSIAGFTTEVCRFQAPQRR